MGLNSKLHQITLIQMNLKFIQMTVQSPGMGIWQSFQEIFFPIFTDSCYVSISPYSSHEDSSCCPSAHVSSLFSIFDESGFITQWKLQPDSPIVFSSSHMFLNEHSCYLCHFCIHCFSYSSNYLTPCLLFITCTLSCPSPLTDTIELKMMAMIMKHFKGRQEECSC